MDLSQEPDNLNEQQQLQAAENIKKLFKRIGKDAESSTLVTLKYVPTESRVEFVNRAFPLYYKIEELEHKIQNLETAQPDKESIFIRKSEYMDHGIPIRNRQDNFLLILNVPVNLKKKKEHLSEIEQTCNEIRGILRDLRKKRNILRQQDLELMALIKKYNL